MRFGLSPKFSTPVEKTVENPRKLPLARLLGRISAVSRVGEGLKPRQYGAFRPAGLVKTQKIGDCAQAKPGRRRFF
jgi:hypothetical protein